MRGASCAPQPTRAAPGNGAVREIGIVQGLEQFSVVRAQANAPPPVLFAAPGPPPSISPPQRGGRSADRRWVRKRRTPVARLAVGPISGSPEITGQKRKLLNTAQIQCLGLGTAANILDWAKARLISCSFTDKLAAGEDARVIAGRPGIRLGSVMVMTPSARR
jgi:hypothetical protein